MKERCANGCDFKMLKNLFNFLELMSDLCWGISVENFLFYFLDGLMLWGFFFCVGSIWLCRLKNWPLSIFVFALWELRSRIDGLYYNQVKNHNKHFLQF